jgi:hypothetical protein
VRTTEFNRARYSWPRMMQASGRHPTRLHTLTKHVTEHATEPPLRDMEDLAIGASLSKTVREAAESCGSGDTGGGCACDSSPTVTAADNQEAVAYLARLDHTVRTAAVARVEYVLLPRPSQGVHTLQPSRCTLQPKATAHCTVTARAVVSASPTSGVHELGGLLPTIRTAEDYVHSLRGRGLVVYLFGELVPEPADHPIIWPSVNAVAETYRLGEEVPELGTGERLP